MTAPPQDAMAAAPPAAASYTNAQPSADEFSPYESWFRLPSNFNRIVAEWFAAIRAAVVAATDREPGNMPANQLGVPSGSKTLYALLLAPVVLGGTLVVAVLLLLFQPAAKTNRPPLGPPAATSQNKGQTNGASSGTSGVDAFQPGYMRDRDRRSTSS